MLELFEVCPYLVSPDFCFCTLFCVVVFHIEEDAMTFDELAAARFPTVQEDAMNRLLEEGYLFDGHTHKLRNGVTNERARATLMIANRFAAECKFKLILSTDEQKLLGKKFVV